MALAERNIYTIQDIENLPEGQRAELINGEIYMMSAPSREHQKILSFLFLEIGNYIKSNNGECEIYPAPFSVFLEEDDKTYLEPDISVVCDKNKLNDKGCNGAPDWIIEIVSPGSRRMDYYTKLSEYKRAGVREYWIVDAMKEIVVVYYMEEDAPPVVYRFSDKVKVNIYEELEIDFSEIDIGGKI